MSTEHRTRILGRVAVVCALAFGGRALAAPGDLDCSFGGKGSGRLALDFGSEAESLLSLRVESDGKLLLGGLRAGSQSDAFALARLLPDGRLDTAFGDGGKVLSGLSADSPAYFAAQVIQPDGGVVAVGTLSYPPSPPRADDVYLARFKADGSPDLTFGSNGAVATDFAGGADYANAVVLQADGKILVAGGAVDASGRPVVALARYAANGTPDTSFDTDGKLTTAVAQPASWDRSEAWSIAVQADGKILVGGLVSRYSSDGLEHTGAFLLIRYSSSGALDATFGNQGVVVTEVGAGPDEIRALKLLGSGQILAAGLSHDEASTGTLGDEDWALARYTAAGSLDTGFGLGGLAVQDWGGNYEEPACLLPLDDGSILVAGFSGNEDAQTHSLTTRSWIARYQADGSPDPTFNSSASAVGDARYHQLAQLSDGRVIAGGSGPANNDFLVSRLLMSAGPATVCATERPGDGGSSSNRGAGGGGGSMSWLSLLVLALAAARRRRIRR